MGLVYQAAKDQITSYDEGVVPWSKALIEPGRKEARVKAAQLSLEEAEQIILKLDQMAMSRQHEGIAAMLAEEMESILLAVRLVKTETKEEFTGILGVGANLDIAWLRPKDVGGTKLNSAQTASLGLYAGTIAAVYTWTQTFVANTAQDIIPEQTSAEEAAVIHLGAIDPVEVPKIDMMTPYLAGIAAPAQSTPFNVRKGFGVQEMPFIRFEKPIIVGPEKKQRISLMPNISGDSKFQLLSLIIARAQEMSA